MMTSTPVYAMHEPESRPNKNVKKGPTKVRHLVLCLGWKAWRSKTASRPNLAWRSFTCRKLACADHLPRPVISHPFGSLPLSGKMSSNWNAKEPSIHCSDRGAKIAAGIGASIAQTYFCNTAPSRTPRMARFEDPWHSQETGMVIANPSSGIGLYYMRPLSSSTWTLDLPIHSSPILPKA
jgi:hypothetical protein